MKTLDTGGGFVRVRGTEARVCELIAKRQEFGLAKYGLTVEGNPLPLRQWLVHALEESLDQSIYLARAIEELDKKQDDNR
jgi:hypothetical protein